MEKIHASKLLAGLVPAGKLTSDPEVALVTTDSREVKPGCIFVAFPGERFDGHDFAARALEQGAEYVVVNHPVPGVPEEKAILCPDSYHAMMVMGANYRSQYHPKMVGVTGSVGKTTTKQMTYAALSAFGETIKTEGNQNNELGMPRTLMRLESSTEYAVIEMGMSHAGEIDRLVRAARPDVGIITCIGVSHIGNLGRNGGVRLRVLNVKHNVFAFDEAFFGQTFDETDAAVVERSVFGELDDADVNHLVRKGGRAQQEEQGSQQGSQLLHHNGVPSFPKSSFFIGTKNAPVVSD